VASLLLSLVRDKCEWPCAANMRHVVFDSLVLLSFRFAIGAGRSEFVMFLCVEEIAV
jgi:hypothetical protein